MQGGHEQAQSLELDSLLEPTRPVTGPFLGRGNKNSKGFLDRVPL